VYYNQYFILNYLNTLPRIHQQPERSYFYHTVYTTVSYFFEAQQVAFFCCRALLKLL
jgi:hypothetical protein